MDMKRKKELLEAYKNRHPEKGVICITCVATREQFLNPSNDTTADFNGIRFQLGAGNHPNKALQSLWNQYGEAGFDFTVCQILKYENPEEGYSDKLEKLLKECLANNPQARRIWKCWR